MAADLFHGEAQIGDHFFEWNAWSFETTLWKRRRRALLLHSPARRRWGRYGSRRFRDRSNFEQADHGVELAGAELVEQLMGVLSVHDFSTSADEAQARWAIRRAAIPSRNVSM